MGGQMGGGQGVASGWGRLTSGALENAREKSGEFAQSIYDGCEVRQDWEGPPRLRWEGVARAWTVSAFLWRELEGEETEKLRSPVT